MKQFFGVLATGLGLVFFNTVFAQEVVETAPVVEIEETALPVEAAPAELTREERRQRAQQIKVIKSIPMALSVNPFEEGEKQLRGRITIDDPAVELARVVYEIAGDTTGVIWQEERVFDGPLPKRRDVIAIPFSYDIEGLGIVGEKVFSVRLFNDRNEEVAIQSQLLNFEQFGQERILSELYDLQITPTEESVTVTATFTSNVGDGDFVARLLFFRDKNYTDRYAAHEQPLLGAVGGTPLEIDFTVTPPARPGVYYALLHVEDEEGNSLSGELRQSFLVEGEFVTVNNIRLTPEQYYKKTDAIVLDVSGFSNKSLQTFQAEVILKSRLDDQLDGLFPIFTETFPLTTDEFGYLTHQWQLAGLEQETGQVFGTILVRNNAGQEVGKYEFTSKRFEPPVASVLDALQDPAEFFRLSGTDRFTVLLIAAVLIFFILIIIWLLIKLLRKQRKLFGFLIALSFGTILNTQAAFILDTNYIYDYYRTVGDFTDNPFDLMAVTGTGTDLDATKLQVNDDFDTELVVREEISPGTFGPDMILTGDDLEVLTAAKADFWVDLKPLNPITTRKAYQLKEVYLYHQTVTDGSRDYVFSLDSLNIDIILNNAAPKASFRIETPGGSEFRDLEADYQAFKETDETKEEFVTRYLGNDLSDYFSNDEIDVDIYCGYVDGDRVGLTAGLGDTAICGDSVLKDGAHLQGLKIRGNFCSDPAVCDDSAPRQFYICDLTGNCQAGADTEIDIRHYDITPPSFGSFTLANGDDETNVTYQRTDNSPLAALDNYLFQVATVSDSAAADDIDAYDGKTLPVPSTVNLHANPCGVRGSLQDYDDFFFTKTIDIGGTPTEVCHPQEIPCAIDYKNRGIVQYLDKDGSDEWYEIASGDLTCAQECAVDETPAFCNATDQSLGIKRCCSSDCSNVFPLEFPICFDT